MSSRILAPVSRLRAPPSADISVTAPALSESKFLARTCTICHHHRRDAMDKSLLRGEQLKAVARRYGVSDDALGRHRKHMQLVIAKAAAKAEQKDLAYGSALLGEIARIRADAERLQVEAERRQDVRSALRAIHERLAVVELEAKLSGQIDTSPKNVTINLQAISPEEAVEYARDILELFGSNISQRELPPPTIQAESEQLDGGCDGHCAEYFRCSAAAGTRFRRPPAPAAS